MKWQEAAKAAAPILTGLLPPPFNMMANYAVREALGLDKSAPDAVIEKMIESGDPIVIAKIKEAENKLILEAKKMDVDIEKLCQEDRADARKMHKETDSATPAILTWTALLMLAVELIYIIHNNGIPQSLDNAFGGALLLAPLTLSQQGFNFYLGSSIGSMKKNKIFEKTTNIG